MTYLCITVLFEAPFWVALCERDLGQGYEACKITFGAEPKEQEVYAFLQANWYRLQFSPPLGVVWPQKKAANPKRLQREIKHQLQQSPLGTKAQQALKLQQEQKKLQRKTRSRAQQAEEKARQYALRQEKKKAKHRGK